jgi:hypothetical protein
VTVDVCIECEQDLEHCHGTAIVHFDGSADCAEDTGCHLIVEQHLFAISCTEVDCDCGDVRPESMRPGTMRPETGRPETDRGAA